MPRGRARAILLGDGDVAGVIAAALPEGGVDIYMGSGGAPEGVLAAAALRCIGGQMQGRLLFENDEQTARARGDGRHRPQPQIQRRPRWPRATSCSPPPASPPGQLLKGVRRFGHGAFTHSIVMRSKSGTVRYIEAHHNFETKTWQPE